MYQHGLDFAPTRELPGLGPLRDVMLDQGYAIAASSFRQRGWALFHAIADNRDLLEAFEREVGQPGEILPFGGSMGGLIALRLAETRGFPPVRGVFALCPAAAGARLWDAAIDLRLAFDTVCAGAGDTAIVIAPGHRFRAVDALLTNFHLPRSSLLLLVSAFAGRERVLAAYGEAVRRGYRFYSYGDAMLIAD